MERGFSACLVLRRSPVLKSFPSISIRVTKTGIISLHINSTPQSRARKHVLSRLYWFIMLIYVDYHKRCIDYV